MYNQADTGSKAPTGVEVMIPETYVIDRVKKNTEDTFTLDLKRADGTGGMRFAPGQFNMIYVYGVGEVPISISGDPTDQSELVHTVRVVGTVTRALRRLEPGKTVGIRGPFGTCWPVEKAKGHDVVVVAGGIGLAPLRPVIYHVLANRKEYGRLVILYGTRTPSDILFRSELEQWGGRFDVDVHVTVDRADDNWVGDVGVVTNLVTSAAFDPLDTVAMICGPEVMMRFSQMSLTMRGIPQDRIYISMERNMKCAVGLCGHCQFGDKFVCKDGPVFSYDAVRALFNKREI